MTDLHETTNPLAAPSAADVEFISVPEWCRRMGCSLDSGYRAVRRDQVPGLFRIGRLIRINWPAFVKATAIEPADRAPDREPHAQGAGVVCPGKAELQIQCLRERTSAKAQVDVRTLE